MTQTKFADYNKTYTMHYDNDQYKKMKRAILISLHPNISVKNLTAPTSSYDASGTPVLAILHAILGLVDALAGYPGSNVDNALNNAVMTLSTHPLNNQAITHIATFIRPFTLQHSSFQLETQLINPIRTKEN